VIALYILLGWLAGLITACALVGANNPGAPTADDDNEQRDAINGRAW